MARTVTAPQTAVARSSHASRRLNQPCAVRPNHIRTRAIVDLSQRGIGGSPCGSHLTAAPSRSTSAARAIPAGRSLHGRSDSSGR
jgi:hypothetical protein